MVTVRGTRQSDARSRLDGLYPDIGPWTSAALWFGAARPAPLPVTPLRDELGIIRQQRLAGLLLRYLRATGAQVEDAEVSFLRRTAFQWASSTNEMSRATAPVVQLLGEHDIPAVIAKGPGIAACYPGPDCRPFSDLDALVAPHQFGRAVQLLESRGWTEELRNVQPWPFFRRWCREGLNLRHPDGGSVDLHHRPPPWLWSGGLRHGELVARAQPLHVAGRTLPCLSPADNLMVAALHLVSDRNDPGRTLLVWRDIVELIRVVPVAEAVSAARAAGLAGWLRAVLQALPPLLDADELIRELPPDPLAHPQRLRLVLSDRAKDLGVIASQTLRLPVASGAAFALGMAVPSRAFLDAKFPGSRHPYFQWWSER